MNGSEAVVCRFASKKVFLKISQISQENISVGATKIGKIFKKTLFLQNTSGGCF